MLLRYAVLSNLVGLHFMRIRFNIKHAKGLFHYGKWMTSQSIASVMFNSLDKILIGNFFGGKIVGIYNVMLSITQLIHFLPASILSFIMPMVARNRKLISVSAFIKIHIITIAFSSFLALTIIFLKQVIFLKFLINNNYNSLFFWLVTCYFLLSLNTPSYFIALGMNKIKTVSSLCILGSFIGSLYLFLFIEKYGLMVAVESKIVYSLTALLLFIPVFSEIRKQLHER
jgi:O-antigen/teichoic acid export membrane protein